MIQETTATGGRPAAHYAAAARAAPRTKFGRLARPGAAKQFAWGEAYTEAGIANLNPLSQFLHLFGRIRGFQCLLATIATRMPGCLGAVRALRVSPRFGSRRPV